MLRRTGFLARATINLICILLLTACGVDTPGAQPQSVDDVVKERFTQTAVAAATIESSRAVAVASQTALQATAVFEATVGAQMDALNTATIQAARDATRAAVAPTLAAQTATARLEATVAALATATSEAAREATRVAAAPTRVAQTATAGFEATVATIRTATHVAVQEVTRVAAAVATRAAQTATVSAPQTATAGFEATVGAQIMAMQPATVVLSAAETRTPGPFRQGDIVVDQPVAATSVDADGCATGITSSFNGTQAIYVVAENGSVPKGTGVFVRLYRDGQPLEDAPELVADRDYTNTCINFVFEPVNQPFEPGSYRAQFTFDGYPGPSITFRVR